MRKFQEIIDQESQKVEDLDLLPLCHTTTEGYFVNIYEEEFIDCLHEYPEPKKKGEPDYVAYFFYGKPAYLVYDEGENFTNDPPLTLIYEHEILKKESFKRLLPFDSGGFPRYKMRRGYRRRNFTHENPNEDAIKGLVKLLYENNNAYLNDEVNTEKLQPFIQECLPIKEIINLYERVKNGEIASGDQVYAIELQFANEVEFTPKYIVLPFTFLTSGYWDESKFKESYPEVIIEYYGRKEGLEKRGRVLKAQEYHELMRKKVIELINSK